MFARARSISSTKWPLAVVIGAAGSLIVAIIVLAFLWPTKAMQAQGLPVSITGPDASVTALQDGFDEAQPDLIDWVEADDRDDAVNQVETRETYGAIVLSDDPTVMPEVVKATAGNATAANMMTTIASTLTAQLQAQVKAAGGDPTGVEATVTELAALSEDDPTGGGLAAAALPLVMGGMIGGSLIAFGIRGTGRKAVALVAYMAASGIVLSAVLGSWFGFLQAGFWVDALALGLSIGATTTLIVGLHSLIGPPGFAVGALITMFIGNPLSGASAPWQFTPAPWGAIGQHMVPGASNWLIKSLSYFPEADTGWAWLTLSLWVAAGAVFLVLGRYLGHGKKAKAQQLAAANARSHVHRQFRNAARG
ncbi:MAG: hypothetical protein QM602_10735 [Microbacterium sp.]